MTPAIVDTNVLVYAYDPTEGAKHQRAFDLLADLSQEGHLVFTAQVLNEFSWVVLRKKPKVASSPEALLEILEEIVESAHVLPLTSDLTLSALPKVSSQGLSFWDALIWASAHRHGIPLIYTEDFQHGREIDGVRFVNPFLPV